MTDIPSDVCSYTKDVEDLRLLANVIEELGYPYIAGKIKWKAKSFELLLQTYTTLVYGTEEEKEILTRELRKGRNPRNQQHKE